MRFEDLRLSAPLLRAIRSAGYRTPTPIQCTAIPHVLAGRDVLGCAQTGTGKTAAFALPILQRLSNGPAHRAAPASRIRALILCPTRELAQQIHDSFRTYGQYTGVRQTVVYGGVNQNPQARALKAGVDVLIATPGRLLDLMGQRLVNLAGVEILVLDEGDRMLDMGFLPDMKRVFAQLPKQRQTLLFSATFSDEIRTLAATLLRNPISVQATPRNTTVEAVDQKCISIERTGKSALLAHLIKDNQWFQVLVFTRTKHGANRLAEYLGKHGVTALAIHGNKSQNARTRALADFKAGELQALVATDIAARGLDIEQLPHVVNFDLPHVPEDYVHRIGRTGRAGATGEAISLVCADDKPLLADIEKVIRREVPREIVAGFEPNPNERAEPIQRGRGGQQRAPQRQAPKREGNEQRRSGQAAAKKTSARPPHAERAAPPSRGEPRNTPRPAKARPADPQRARAAPASTAPRNDASSTVRTNIPGLAPPGHRRGR